MFFGDPARPRTLQHMLKRFRLANAIKWLTQSVVNEPINAFEHGSVFSQPLLILLPGMTREGQSHGTNFRAFALPFFA
jgi:hypothetical protein